MPAALRKNNGPAGIVRIPKALDARLSALSRETGRPKSWYARKALESYIEDMEDIAAAEAALAEGGPVFSLAQMKKRLGLGG